MINGIHKGTYDYGSTGNEKQLGFAVYSAGDASALGSKRYGLKDQNLTISDKTLDKADFLVKSGSIREIPTDTGIGLGVANVVTSWNNAAIMSRKTFKRDDTPKLTYRVKVKNTVAPNINARPMIGWYPANGVDSNNLIQTDSFSKNEYALYFLGTALRAYRKNAQGQLPNGTTNPAATVSGVLAIGDILDVTHEIKKSGGSCITVVRTRNNVTTTIFYYDYFDSPDPFTVFSDPNNFRVGAHFMSNGDPVIELQSLRVTTGKSSTGFEFRRAEFQDFSPRGIANSRFEGTKISSPDFNVPSNDTPDGKPVVEIEENSGNRIITQSPGTSGNFEIRQ